MKNRRGRFFLSRVIKINLTQDELMDAICNPAIVHVRNHNWTIIDIVDKRDSTIPFVYGKLVKYADDSLDVVDELSHKQSQSLTPNLVKASSPFVYLPLFSGLCFLYVYNGIQDDVFPRRFKKIIENSRKLKYDDLLIECEVDAVADYSEFRKKILEIKKVIEIDAKVFPPNPLFGPYWKSLKDYLMERDSTMLKINEQSEKKEGIKTKLPKLIQDIENNQSIDGALPGLADAALLMAADGYGKGKLVGEGKNKEIIEVNTQDAQKSFLLEKDPSPEQLALHACKEFRKVIKERDMSH